MDLKKEIQSLLPIKDHSETGRYRVFPKIIVEAPECDLNTTISMPDIHSLLKTESRKKSLYSNTSDINSSCPDLRNETYFDIDSITSMETEDVFEDYDDFSENVSVCSESYHHDSEPDSSNDLRYFNDRHITTKMVRRKKKEDQPTEVLKKNLKVKHSSSLHHLSNRRKQEPDPNYDSYYTVHGKNNLTHHSPSAYSNYPHFDYPQATHPKHNVRTNYGSVDRIRNYPHHSVLPPYHHEHSFYNRSISSPSSNLYYSHNNFNAIPETEIIYKCCCGGVNCKKVVPIFDYLETYFIKTVRF